MAEPSRERAGASARIAVRFTRLMNATTRRSGMLTDPPIIAACTAVLALALLGAVRLEAPPAIVWALGIAAALPVSVAVAVGVSLLGARGQIVDWLASLPFPVENVNALLNGLGESLEVSFAGACPTSAELNAELDKVSPDCFVVHGAGVHDGEADTAASRVVEVRLGVVESKWNPAESNHRRYRRVRELCDDVLVALHAKFPIVEVRIK